MTGRRMPEAIYGRRPEYEGDGTMKKKNLIEALHMLGYIMGAWILPIAAAVYIAAERTGYVEYSGAGANIAVAIRAMLEGANVAISLAAYVNKRRKCHF